MKVLFDDGVNDAVSGDLKKGDQVIIEGQLRVIPGAKVTITGAKRQAGARQGRDDQRPAQACRTPRTTKADRQQGLRP